MSGKNTKNIKSAAKPKRKEIGLFNLITVEIVEQWYNCQVNFLVPSMVLINSPIVFLVVIFLYSGLGVGIAIRKRDRLNSLLLSIYPLVFHICFMVFYVEPPTRVVVYTEMICLLVFLIGALHNSLFLVYEIVVTAAKGIKHLCKSNRVDPKEQEEVKGKQN